MKKVAVVVPTLFSRSDYLISCLRSIRSISSDIHIVVIGPRQSSVQESVTFLADAIMEEPPNTSLSGIINHAVQNLPSTIEIATWIGDDDLFYADGAKKLLEHIQENEEVSLVFGSCNYIDESGSLVGRNKSGQWATRLMKFGPFLAPQPGSFFRKDLFLAEGGLDTELGMAFDYDLFFRLARRGSVKYVGATPAAFRWHKESLSVSQRGSSVSEASLVRKKHSQGTQKIIVKIVNPFISATTYLAGYVVTHKLNRKHLRSGNNKMSHEGK